MPDSWIEISCDVPAEAADIVADFLATLSGNGVCTENIAVDAFSPDEIVHSSTVSIKAYFTPDLRLEQITGRIRTFLDELGRQSGLHYPDPAVSGVGTQDWSTSWKEHFKPLQIGKRLLILPTWEILPDNPVDVVLRLDPGMAFGTGGHETTRLCLELMERIIEEHNCQKPPSVLDLGTGSGILAMAAARLGACPVTAVDIDPLAIDVARENISINGLSERVNCSTTPLESLEGRFDIILANILAEELVRLSPLLDQRLSAGGDLILSGILAEKESLVRDGFARKTGMTFCETVRQGEWLALHYRNGDRP